MTEEEQIEAVKANGFHIQHIANPSKEVQMAALTSTRGSAIQYIDHPYIDVKLEAVYLDARNIQHIVAPSIDVILAALASDGNIAHYIDYSILTEDALAEIADDYPWAVGACMGRYATERLQVMAIERDYRCILDMDNPCPQAKKLAIIQQPLFLTVGVRDELFNKTTRLEIDKQLKDEALDEASRRLMEDKNTYYLTTLTDEAFQLVYPYMCLRRLQRRYHEYYFKPNKYDPKYDMLMCPHMYHMEREAKKMKKQ